jgi:hypothetical protein
VRVRHRGGFCQRDKQVLSSAKERQLAEAVAHL